MDPIEILGIGSALLALYAFVGNQYGKLRASGFWYDALNFLSAAGLFVYAYAEWVVPFMITNSVWGFVSGMDVIRHLRKARGLKKRGK
jgi:hypothetical protein